jgi:protein disulfide-isomerase
MSDLTRRHYVSVIFPEKEENMKKLKMLIAAVLLLCSWLSISAADHSLWMKNFDQAKKTAVVQNKPLLVYFTGSDWCPWCIKFDEEVFSKQKFLDYLKDNFIPVVIDFPMYQEQPPAVKKENAQLKAKYGVVGFPTLLVLSPQGKVLAQSNYIPGGPENVKRYLEKAKEQIK